MKKFFGFVVVCLLAFWLVGCYSPKDDDVNLGVDIMNLEIGNYTFEVDLETNSTVAALLERLPLTVEMQELHGNEKYYYLDTGLPSHAGRVGQIKAGEIMLWGNDCLVIFYQSFSTPYTYTRIGQIKDTTNLLKAVGSGNIQVKWNV